jgi:hypothetical protein
MMLRFAVLCFAQRGADKNVTRQLGKKCAMNH